MNFVDVPPVEESVDGLVNEIQNCSLYDGTDANSEISKTSGTSDSQNGKQFKQGSLKSNGKDSYQIIQKTKPSGTTKGTTISLSFRFKRINK